MTSKYTNKNGGKKLLAALMAIAMVFVAGFVLISDSAASDAAVTELTVTSGLTDVSEDQNIAGGGKYLVKENVTLTTSGANTSGVSIYVVEDKTVTITSAVNVGAITIIPASLEGISESQKANVLTGDVAVVLTGFTSGTIIIKTTDFGHYTSGSDNSYSSMEISGNDITTIASIEVTNGSSAKTVSVASSGLSVPKDITVTGVQFGYKLMATNAKDQYNAPGKDYGTVNLLKAGDIISISNATVTVIQGDDTVSIDVQSSNVTVTYAPNHPNISGSQGTGDVVFDYGIFGGTALTSVTVTGVQILNNEIHEGYAAQLQKASANAKAKVFGNVIQKYSFDENVAVTVTGTLTVAKSATLGNNVTFSGSGTIVILGNAKGSATEVTNKYIGVDGYAPTTTGAKNTNGDPKTDSLISGTPIASSIGDAILNDTFTIPKGTTLTLNGDLGLNGKKLVVEGTLVVASGSKIFSTGYNDLIVLGTSGKIQCDGAIGNNLPVKISESTTPTNSISIVGVTGAEFALKDGIISLTGDVSALSGSNDHAVALIGGAKIFGNLTIGTDVTLKIDGTSGSSAVAKSVIVIDGILTSDATKKLSLGDEASITVNGMMKKAVIVSVNTGDYDGSTLKVDTIKDVTFGMTTTDDAFKGFTIYTEKVTTGTGSSKVTSLKAFINGSVEVVIVSPADDTPIFAVDGSGVVEVADGKTLDVMKGAKVTFADVVINGTIIEENGATVAPTTYVGAKYTIGKNTDAKTYYASLDAAMKSISIANDKTVEAQVSSIDSLVEVGSGETLKLLIASKVSSTGEIVVSTGGKLDLTNNLTVDGKVIVAAGSDASVTYLKSDTVTEKADGSKIYASLKVAIDEADDGSIITIDTITGVEDLTIKSGVKVVVENKLGVSKSLTIAEGAELVGGTVNVTGDASEIATITVNGTLDLSAGLLSGAYNLLVSNGTTILNKKVVDANGAYYVNDDGYYVYTTVAKAAASGNDVFIVGEVEETGSVSAEDAVITIDGTKVSISEIVLTGDSEVVINGNLDAKVVTDLATIAIDGKADIITKAGESAVTEIVSFSGKLDVVSGEAVIGTFTATDKTEITVGSSAKLTVASGEVFTLKADGESTVSVDGELIIDGKLVATGIKSFDVSSSVEIAKTGILNADEVVVTGSINVIKDGVFSVKALIVGTAPTTLAASGIVSGAITLADGSYVKYYPGSDISAATFTGGKSTEFYVNGSLYATVYAKGNVTCAAVIDDAELSEIPGYATYSGEWKDADNVSADAVYVGVKTKVYATLAVQTVNNIVASVQTGLELRIDAVFYPTNEDVANLSVGPHVITVNTLPGYSGSVVAEVWVSGVRTQVITDNVLNITSDMVDKPVIIAAVFGSAPGPEPTPVDPSEDYIVSTSVVDNSKVIVSVISLDGGYLVAGTEVEVTFTTLVETVAFGQTIYKPTPVTETITIGDDKPTINNSTYELADILGDKYAVINVMSTIGTTGYGNMSLNYKG